MHICFFICSRNDIITVSHIHTSTEIYITMAATEYHDLESSNLDLCLGNARRSLINCPYDNCGGGSKRMASKYRLEQSRPWQLELYCAKCQRFWYACRVCAVNTKAYTDHRMMARHYRLYHTIAGWKENPEPEPEPEPPTKK
jgi:hypothetical protein